MVGELLKGKTINPDVFHGKPTIINKHYAVGNMLELMALGKTTEAISSH
ncbi:MAG: DUF433 domain-containing protein [Acidobacteriota bacterium]